MNNNKLFFIGLIICIIFTCTVFFAAGFICGLIYNDHPAQAPVPYIHEAHKNSSANSRVMANAEHKKKPINSVQPSNDLWIYTIEVGQYDSAEKAMVFFKYLMAYDYKPRIQKNIDNSLSIYIGEFKTSALATQTLYTIIEAGFDTAKIIKRKKTNKSIA